MEKASSNLWAEHMCTMGTVVTLDQGDGDEGCAEFWHHLLDDGEIGPDLEDDDEELSTFRPQLYRVDGDPTVPPRKVAQGIRIRRDGPSTKCLHRRFLDEGDVFLLYCGWELFVWIGRDADASEKLAVAKAADRFAKQEPRAANIPWTALKSGRETEAFNALFADDNEELKEEDETGDVAKHDAELWERPSWASEGGGKSMLRATKTGEQLRTSGDLAKPITSIRDS
jgi:Gelsolin repeat